jgi:hypothetical protein
MHFDIHNGYVIPGINISNFPSRLLGWPCSREVFCFKYVLCKGATWTVVLSQHKWSNSILNIPCAFPNTLRENQRTNSVSQQIQSTDPHLFPCTPLKERRYQYTRTCSVRHLPTTVTLSIRHVTQQDVQPAHCCRSDVTTLLHHHNRVSLSLYP